MLDRALKDLRSGKPILVFDDDKREGETDIMVASQHMTPDYIRMMRQDGGGLICVTVRERDAMKIGLPFIEEYFARNENFSSLFRNSDLRYDLSSAFSITLNLRTNFTGITDIERSATIKGLAQFISGMDKINGSTLQQFSALFRAPGHVFTLIARDGYFNKRRGHTELGTYLVEKAGMIPSIAMVELLSDTGRAKTKEEAAKYAEAHSLSFIEGKSIIAAWADDANNGNGGL